MTVYLFVQSIMLTWKHPMYWLKPPGKGGYSEMRFLLTIQQLLITDHPIINSFG